MLACRSGYLDLVRALIKQGANLDFQDKEGVTAFGHAITCLLYTSPSPRDQRGSRMPSSA